MAKDPADRYESCHELVRELELALGMPAPVSLPGGGRTPDSGRAGRHADATSDGSRAEFGTVTGDVPGGSQHPSFPSDQFARFPAQVDASYETSPPADHEPDFEEYPGYDQDDDAGSYWDQGEPPDWDQSAPVTPPAPPRRRNWRLVTVVAAAAVVLVAVTAVLLGSLLSEDYRTYSSNQTLVPFRLDHPASWGSAVGPASDAVLAPDPTAADELFFNKGTPQDWASMADTLRSGSPDDVWLYVYTSAATFDTSWIHGLQESIVPLLPATTEFEPAHSEVSVAGSPADQMEAVTSDPDNPQTRLRVMVDVVQPPGAQGAVLLAFFAPADGFEAQRPTFERIRDSLQIIR
jgi:hypothetical protein